MKIKYKIFVIPFFCVCRSRKKMQLSSSTFKEVKYDKSTNKHLFKVVLRDSNYDFDEMTTFLVPMQYKSGTVSHFDLQKKMINPKFTYLVNGKEVQEKVNVTFKHKPATCDVANCWHETKIKRPTKHKKVKHSPNTPVHTWPQCIFSFELVDVEDIEFFRTSFFRGDADQTIKISVSSNFQE
jgi:hypothetical protein